MLRPLREHLRHATDFPHLKHVFLRLLLAALLVLSDYLAILAREANAELVPVLAVPAALVAGGRRAPRVLRFGVICVIDAARGSLHDVL